MLSPTTDFIIINFVILAAVSFIALLVNMKRDLMMLQQNSYRNERYTRWYEQSGESTASHRIVAMIALLLVALVAGMSSIGSPIMIPIASILMLWVVVKLLRAKYKKPLVWTARARRIYGVMLGVSIIVIAVIALIFHHSLGIQLAAVSALVLALCILSNYLLLLANIILKPVEAAINKRYYDDAASILASMPDLKIIGITGSYGKTSTKHYLHRILSEQFDTLMTPGSFNTPMGVIRTVREYLKPYNEVFIVEMGAKNIGDIKEICDLVHPEIGIVTAVGEQHLESFKTIENIQKTKFELVDALPADGFAAVNDDFEYVANRPVSNVDCKRYAVRNTANADYVATDIEIDHSGTTFTISGPGIDLRLHTRLVGECNISNLMGAVIVAKHLGMTDDKIRYAVEKIEQVEHRLSMKRTAGGVTIIDDAFNSNPTGSKMALEVLGMMKPGKRIVVTPGMIELGDRQYDLNKELGKVAARNADIAIVVGEYNSAAIAAGLEEGEMPKENVRFASTFNEAQQILQTLLAPGDAVLYENDLPDTFK